MSEPHEAEGHALLQGELGLAYASDAGLVVAQRLLGEELARRGDAGTRWHARVMPKSWYAALDFGIRFPVLVLHAAGLETCQSCDGSTGHAYPTPPWTWRPPSSAPAPPPSRP